jgi:Bacterial self-protective colicin-like immunity
MAEISEAGKMNCDSIAKYADLIKDFLQRRIDARDFETQYLSIVKRESVVLPREVFDALDRLFADVDAFCPNPELCGEDDLNEEQLRQRCLETVEKLSPPQGWCRMSLIGTWVIERTDVRALTELADVILDFSEDGHLIYTIRDETKHQIIKMQYKVEDSVIVTDQPSAPNVERTGFSLSPDGSLLTLAFGGTPYRFRRHRRRWEHFSWLRMSALAVAASSIWYFMNRVADSGRDGCRQTLPLEADSARPAYPPSLAECPRGPGLPRLPPAGAATARPR